MADEDEGDYVEMGILGAIAFMEQHWSRIESRPVLVGAAPKLRSEHRRLSAGGSPPIAEPIRMHSYESFWGPPQ